MPKSQDHSAKLSSKGQVVIPADVRRHLGLSQGSVLRFVLDDDGVRLLATVGDVRRLKGRLSAPPAAVSVEDMNRATRERRASIGASVAAKQR